MYTYAFKKWIRFLKINGIMDTLQKTRSIHDSMNLPKIEFVAYIYILL